MKELQSQIFSDACAVRIFENGRVIEYKKGEESFSLILQQWSKMTEQAVEMPALGVSIHDCTIQARNSGLWIEFLFSKPKEYNEMPFETLLIHCESESYGFNLERLNNGEYGGRCFYLNLRNCNMSEFCSVISKQIH